MKSLLGVSGQQKVSKIAQTCLWMKQRLPKRNCRLFLLVSPFDNEANEYLHTDICHMTGNLTPTKIPVNVYLPSLPTATDALFQTPDLDTMSIPQMQPRRPKIVMTSPERPPISGLVEISVIYDETRPRGIAVDVNGAMGSDIKPDMLEEISRRGGTLGLSGRVWAKAHGSL